MNELNSLNQEAISNIGVAFNNVENTIQSQTMASEIVFSQEQAVAKPYTLRKLKATELFSILNILKKIGFKKFTELLQKEEVKDFVVGLKNGETGEIADNTLVGIGSIIFEFLDIILDGAVNCETELFTILSNVSNLSLDEVKQLDLDVMISMIIELVKDNVDFIKAASKYLK